MTPDAALAPHPALAGVLDRLAAAHPLLPVRRTERLTLRPWQERDREPFAALNADPEVMAHFPAPLDRAGSDALVDRFRAETARRGFGMYAVEERASREFVGMVGLAVPGWEAPFLPAVEIGWRLARPWWGRGLAEEAARDVLAWAFGTLRLPRLVSFTSLTNTRSWRLMERLGMARAAEFEHPRVPEGHPLRPHVLYVLDAPAPVAPAAPAATPAPVPTPARPSLPQVWIDGDGAPRTIKELVWRAVERGRVAVTLVANRPVVVPRHRHVQAVVVGRGLDVADDWLVAHAGAGDLVVTSDIPLAAELVARGVEVVSPRGEWFTPGNVGEKLSLRDFHTEARASGLLEGGGPAAFDERARRAFANALDGWITRRARGG